MGTSWNVCRRFQEWIGSPWPIIQSDLFLITPSPTPSQILSTCELRAPWLDLTDVKRTPKESESFFLVLFRPLLDLISLDVHYLWMYSPTQAPSTLLFLQLNFTFYSGFKKKHPYLRASVYQRLSRVLHNCGSSCENSLLENSKVIETHSFASTNYVDTQYQFRTEINN